MNAFNPTETFAGFLTNYNAKSQELHEFKDALLDFMRPYGGGRDYAWLGIVVTAMHCSGHGAVAEPGTERLYDRIQSFSKYLQKESGKRPLGEFSDYRVLELLLLASNIATSRPRPRHGRTQSPVPVDIICDLAFHFRHCTGYPPGASDGKFAGFVSMFWEATGHKRKYNTVVADIKKAHRARPAVFKGETDET